MRIDPGPEFDNWEYSNEFLHVLPASDTDLDIIMKMWAPPKEVNGEYFGMDLRAGSDTCPTSIYMGTGLGPEGPYVSAARIDGCGDDAIKNRRAVRFSLNQPIYLKIERRQGDNYRMWVSDRGVSWTFVNELRDIPFLTILGVTGWDTSDGSDYYVEVDWVRFEIPG